MKPTNTPNERTELSFLADVVAELKDKSRLKNFLPMLIQLRAALVAKEWEVARTIQDQVNGFLAEYLFYPQLSTGKAEDGFGVANYHWRSNAQPISVNNEAIAIFLIAEVFSYCDDNQWYQLIEAKWAKELQV